MSMCKLVVPAQKLAEACIHCSVLQSEAGLPTKFVTSLLVDATSILHYSSTRNVLPAAVAAIASSPSAKAATRNDLPVP